MKYDDPFGWDGMAREHILNVEPSGDEWSLVVIETGERKPLLAKPDPDANNSHPTTDDTMHPG